MADNTQLDPGSGGDVISTEDVSGVKIPRTKIAIGAHGTDEGDATVDNPLPTTAQGPNATGTTPTGKPVLTAGTDSTGKVAIPRIDSVRNATVSVCDPTTSTAAQAVKLASGVTGEEYGGVVHALVHQMSQALLRPIKVMSDVLAMAQDTVGRLRGIVDINSGTVTTVTTVTTCSTVTSMTNINAQNAQTTLLYGVELGTWANAVRSRIT